MPGVHLFTSFTYGYLSRARVLAKSVRGRHPDWRLCAIVVDAAPPGFDDATWRNDFDYVVDASTLFPGVWSRWIFKHDVVEACTAVKGHALLHLMSQGGEKIIYLDPDIAVFHSLQPIIEQLDQASIILTPHQVEPNLTENEIVDNELTSLQTGIYNLGFLAVRNDSEGRKMGKWWAGRLFHACYDDQKNGLFTDQKYCDLVPGLFSNVKIERDPGYNVASWNISRRLLEIAPTGDVLVNKSLLRFYHFTKIHSDGDVMTERYARGRSAVFEIWNWYKRSIKAMELPGIPDKYWGYARFEDGTPIPKNARILYRSRPDLMSYFTEPFGTGAGSFQEWFRLNGSQSTERSEIARRIDEGSAPVARAGSVAAIVHVHYPELLPEIRDLLAGYTGALKLFVTTCNDNVRKVKNALNQCSQPFEVFTFENRGRDIRPFLRVLPKVFEERYDYIIKLHTKKSGHRDDGDLWRRELLESLADPAELAWIVERLGHRPEVGIVGPSEHIVDMNAYWGSNEATVLRLAERMGIGPIVPDPNVFVAGSMFVARREALSALLSIGFSDDEFEAEMGQTDGTMAHAVERAMTYSAAAYGLRVAGKPASAAGSYGDLAFGGNLKYRFAPRSDIA
jgi:Rhamnan synthesis protein F